MAKPKSEFLKAAGKMWALMQAIVNAVLDLGGTDEDLHRVLTENGLAKKIAEVIMASRQKVCETYKVIVDYGKTLAEMIKAGNYDWVNDDINNKHFPLEGPGSQEVELVLVHLNRNSTTREVHEHLASLGLESAKIEQLLAFGATYPELQRQFPIVALGSSFVSDVSGYRNCPCLLCGGGGRELCLGWGGVGNRWGGSCRFLAVHK